MRYLFFFILLVYSSLSFSQADPVYPPYNGDRIGSTISCSPTGLPIEYSSASQSCTTKYVGCPSTHNGYAFVQFLNSYQLCGYGTCPAGTTPGISGGCLPPCDSAAVDQAGCSVESSSQSSGSGPLCVDGQYSDECPAPSQSSTPSESSSPSCPDGQSYGAVNGVYGCYGSGGSGSSSGDDSGGSGSGSGSGSSSGSGDSGGGSGGGASSGSGDSGSGTGGSGSGTGDSGSGTGGTGSGSSDGAGDNSSFPTIGSSSANSSIDRGDCSYGYHEVIISQDPFYFECQPDNSSASSISSSSSQSSQSSSASSASSSSQASSADSNSSSANTSDQSSSVSGGNSSNPSSQGSATAADCKSEPSCDGDPVNCAILKQLWINNCDGVKDAHIPDAEKDSKDIDDNFTNLINSEHPATDSDGSLSSFKKDVVDLSKKDFGLDQLSDIAASASSGSCPQAREIKLSVGSYQVSYQPLCDLAEKLSDFVVLIFSYLSAVIIYKALQGN